jgi:hypothetical protein
LGTFPQKNANCLIAESIDRFIPLSGSAKAPRVRGYVACVGDVFTTNRSLPDVATRTYATIGSGRLTASGWPVIERQ